MIWSDCDSDDDDEEAELMRELEKIKRERQEQKQREVCQETVLKSGHNANGSRNENEQPRSKNNASTRLHEATRCSTRRTLPSSAAGTTTWFSRTRHGGRSRRSPRSLSMYEALFIRRIGRC